MADLHLKENLVSNTWRLVGLKSLKLLTIILINQVFRFKFKIKTDFCGSL